MNQCNEYLIQVSLNEHSWDNPSAPYYWCILGHYENWCNEASGWSTSIDQAFDDAKRHYNKINNLK
jgi:hypothetical protein